MPSRCREFVDSRLRRSPPDRASAVPYGQAGENAMRFPRLAHRSAAAHKLHSTPQQDRMNLISGKGETSSRLPAFSLFLPGSCPNYRDRRTVRSSWSVTISTWSILLNIIASRLSLTETHRTGHGDTADRAKEPLRSPARRWELLIGHTHQPDSAWARNGKLSSIR